MPTQSELQHQFLYNPDTGLWKHKIRRQGAKQGWFAGTPKGKDKHLTIYFQGKNYPAATMAWLYIYGELVLDLDHENRDPSDNRIENLRKASRSQQNMNSSARRDNSSGFRGIHFLNRGTKPWWAYIEKDGIRRSKFFETKQEAISWRMHMETILFKNFVAI